MDGLYCNADETSRRRVPFRLPPEAFLRKAFPSENQTAKVIDDPNSNANYKSSFHASQQTKTLSYQSFPSFSEHSPR